jgi:ribosome biogenesis GTPase A
MTANNLKQITEKLCHISQNYMDKNILQKEKTLIFKNIEAESLRIVFYGAYNSGKSTLINVLLKKRIAQIGDIPTTDKISEYNFNNSILVDTPGVNSLYEHEQKTAEEIKRADLILFLIREGEHDTKTIYDRLMELYNEKKNLIIVLNFENNNELDNFRTKITSNLFLYADKHNVSLNKIETTPFIYIDVETAENSINENNLQMLEYANYYDFIQRFTQWFMAFNNEQQIYKTLSNQIENTIIKPVLNIIESKSTKNDELENINKYLSSLDREKNTLKIEIYNFISSEIFASRNEIYDSLKSDNPQIMLKSISDSIWEKVLNKMQGKIEEINSDLICFENVLTTDKIKLSDSNNDSTSDLSSELLKKGEDFLVLNSENIVLKTIEAGKKLKIPFIIKNEEILLKWSKKLSWILVIGVEIIRQFRAIANEKKQNEEIRRATFEFNKIFEEICSEMKSNFHYNSEALIDSTFEVKEKELINEKEKLVTSSNQIEKDKQSILDIRHKLHNLKAF